MPEGDTIHRAANHLRPALEGRRILGVRSALVTLENAGLVGKVVDRVDARGKHLFFDLDDGRSVHSHLGMRGSWRIYAAGAAPRAGESLRLSLETADNVVVCWNAPLVEIVRGKSLPAHPVVGRLGSDPLRPDFDAARVLLALREQGQRPIAEALLDQRVIAGIGNVYKSELLFLCRTNPFAPAAALDTAKLAALVETARRLMRANVHGHGRTTRRASDGSRVWVYRRSGQPCLHCGARVRMRRGALGRSTYYCPSCQGVD
jgi:endonuclease VIII